MTIKISVKKAATKSAATKKAAAGKKAAVKKAAAKTGGRTWQYPAFQLEQRPDPAPKLVMFFAPVGEILQWAKVEWLSPGQVGPQREKRGAKVKAIANFLKEKKNTIPTALIIAFNDKKTSISDVIGTGKSKSVTLKINSLPGALASVVDGQHRLYGVNDASSQTLLPIVGILGASEVERAFQFLVINNKATKVPPTHTKALLASMKSEDLAARLKNAKIAFDAEGINDVDIVNSDPDSPFHNSISWTITEKDNRIVQATAIEYCLEYLKGLRIQELDERDVCRDVFLAMWRAIKAHWPTLWKAKSRLISKVGIICLTRYIVDIIVAWSENEQLDIEITDLEQIEKLTLQLISNMDSRFWTISWAENASGGFDTSQGRERVYTAIATLQRNGSKNLPWFTGIDIIEKAEADI